jgi:outer membrane protein OmpA-like peptidoglycan-associated protein
MLEPVVHEKFSRYEGTPKQIPFVLTAKGKKSAVTSWKFSMNAGGTEIYHSNGSGEPPQSFNWDIKEADLAPIAVASDHGEKLTATLDVTDGDGLSSSDHYDVPLSKSRYPFELSRLSLVVFDFDKSAISKQNKEMVSTFVSHSIKPESESRITGSTDRLGELDHNQELSQARADAVATLVTAQNPDAKLTEVKGIGPAEQIELNSTPEGRYYCRTVTVQVQTPLQ